MQNLGSDTEARLQRWQPRRLREGVEGRARVPAPQGLSGQYPGGATPSLPVLLQSLSILAQLVARACHPNTQEAEAGDC